MRRRRELEEGFFFFEKENCLKNRLKNKIIKVGNCDCVCASIYRIVN